MIPETRYTKSGDVHLAYQVLGRGPPDLLFLPAFGSNVEIMWEEPRFAAFLRRLASFSRLILFDPRCTGLSDPVALTEALSFEQWLDDATAVLEAAGSKRVALFGNGHGGAFTMLVAATRPDLVSALVITNGYARLARAPDYPWGLPPPAQARLLIKLEETFGSSTVGGVFFPSAMKDERFHAWYARYDRLRMSRGTALALMRMIFEADLRPVLSSIRVPTLVLHRSGDGFVRVDHGRYLASHIPGARYVELPGGDHFPFLGDSAAILDEVEEFLTGTRAAVEADRVLATVLFTDIVRSTDRAAELGDRQYRQLLDAHDELVPRELDRFRGRLVKTTGDGVLATFDGPARAIRCAGALREVVRGIDVEVRVGLHTGEVELRDDDVGGIAVHIAARVLAAAGPGEILVSRTVKDLVAGSGLAFTDRGVHALKGIPDEWQLFAVDASTSP